MTYAQYVESIYNVSRKLREAAEAQDWVAAQRWLNQRYLMHIYAANLAFFEDCNS
jgi:hypothetical protein